LVYFSEQRSIEGELTSVHFARGSVADRRFIFHLIDKVVLVGPIDAINSVFQSFLFVIPVLFIEMPHLSLLVNVVSIILFSLVLVRNLLSKEVSHLLLLVSLFLGSSFLQLSLSHFLLVFISGEHHVFQLLFFIHFGKNIIGHLVHEFLSTSLSVFHLLDSVTFLFLKHFGVFFLGPKILKTLFIISDFLSSLVFFILLKHFLEVFLLLLSLFHLHRSFGLKLGSKSVDVAYFLIKLIFVVSTLSPLFLLELLVALVLIIHNLFTYRVGLVDFSLF